MQFKPKKIEAICALEPTAAFSFRNEEITEWRPSDSEVQPTKSEINAKLVELTAQWEAEEYARNRQLEYPTIEELTVALYDTDDKAALETKRAAVKTKWPKDNYGPVL